MEYDIRGGQGISPFVSIGEKYGDQLVKGIVQAGANIEEGLKRVTTNRELQGLNQTLSQIDPKTPDYPQKLLMLKGQFPLAAYDPRGLASVSMGFKAHMDWQNGQQALQQAGAGLQKSKDLIDYRNANRPPGQGGVDLNPMFEGASVLDQLAPQNPATGAGFAPEAPLAGMNGGLAENSAGFEGSDSIVPSQDFQPVGKPTTPGGAPVDPLVKRALRPLYETSKATGIKPSPSQAFGAVASERTRVQQQALQDDRQAQQDKQDADREQAKAVTDETRAAKDAATQQRLILNAQLSSVKSDVSRLTAELDRHVKTKTALNKKLDALNYDDKHQEAEAELKAWESEKNDRERALQEVGTERTRLLEELKSIGKDTEEKVYRTEKEALAAGKEVGDTVMLINPRTGKPAKARLE